MREKIASLLSELNPSTANRFILLLAGMRKSGVYPSLIDIYNFLREVRGIDYKIVNKGLEQYYYDKLYEVKSLAYLRGIINSIERESYLEKKIYGTNPPVRSSKNK